MVRSAVLRAGLLSSAVQAPVDPMPHVGGAEVGIKSCIFQLSVEMRRPERPRQWT